MNHTETYLQLEYSIIHSFYYPSKHYQNFEDSDHILIPPEKYWHFQPDTLIEDSCNEPTSIKEFIRLLLVCDYWGFESLPMLVLLSYEHMNKTDKQQCLHEIQWLQESYYGPTSSLAYYLKECSVKLSYLNNSSPLSSQLLTICEKGYLDLLIYCLTYTQPTIKHIETIKDRNDKHCLMKACQAGHLSIVQYLITNTICGYQNIYLSDCWGINALSEACYAGHLSIVQYLFENPIKPFTNLHLKDKRNRTILMQACEAGHLSIVQYLLSQGFKELHIQDKEIHWNALFMACSRNHISIVRYLLENPYCRFTDIHARDINQRTILMIACDTNDPITMIQYLLENNLCPYRDIYAQNNYGWNVLTIACFLGHLHVVQYLLENTICPFENYHLPNSGGKTVYAYAKTVAIKEYLQSKGLYA